jgi:uncharacterized cofD-like protein
MMTAEGLAGLRIVSLGGGTGLSSLLLGLKEYVGKQSLDGRPVIESLTAVVTVTDDGGSSGRLREEFQILPPGDIRNCMVALAEDEHLLTRLFQYRFESEGDLHGHSFGNLFLAALAGVTGDFLEAIKVSSEVLAIKGRIIPSTAEDITLVAELEDGSVVEGETNITKSRTPIARLMLSRPDCRPLPESIKAIAEADIITLGPGSLYTSILPNLLVHGVVDAIKASPALKIYICNIMTQPGETTGFTVEDHLKVLLDPNPGLDLDYVLVNSTRVSPALSGKYRSEGADQVEMAQGGTIFGRVANTGPIGIGPSRFSVLAADLLSENDVVRHDPHKLARLVLEVHIASREHAQAR